MIESIKPYIVSFRLDGIQYIATIFAPLYFNYWNNIDNMDHCYVLLCSIGFIYGMIINNYYDYETDLKNNPEKVMLSKLSLNIWSKICGLMYLTLHLFISANSNSIYYKYGSLYAFTLVSIYTKYLKKIILIKNISTAIYMCFLPIFVFVAEKHNLEMAYYSSIPLTCLITIREVMLDICDKSADESANIITLPTLFGIKNTQNILKLFVICLWILGIKIQYGNNALYPCKVGLISNICSYSLYRIHTIIGDNDRKYMVSAMFFYYLWIAFINSDSINLYMAIFCALFIFGIIKSNIGLFWKESVVFNRKLVHTGIGCLLISLPAKDVSMIVLLFLFGLVFILPSLRLGIEKYNEPLSYDVGVLCWLIFSLLWSLLHINKPIESYIKCLPFYISDPAGALVGRTTDPNFVKIIWKNKSLQGSLMILMVSYSLTQSVILCVTITIAELFGQEYDNALIGSILIIYSFFDPNINLF